ncbi:MAG: DUF3999 domain-containing protein [Clostridia bacterium]|nr:DUF3999 domain-containing protein [Clostridia bacterium]
MKKLILKIFIFCIAIANMHAVCAEGVHMEKWKCTKDINISGSSKYKAFYLDEEVYRHAMSDLSDLRIVDAEGKTVSYYLHGAASLENQSRIIYASELEDKFGVKDLKLEKNDTYIDYRLIPLKEGADFKVNRLRFLELPSDNFYKNVEVYGSADGVDWTLAASDSLYRVDGKTKATVSFGDVKKFRFYRVRILQNLEMLQLGRMEAVYDFSQKVQKSFVKSAELKNSIENKDKKTFITIVNDDRLKIKAIRLDVSGNFSRSYEIRSLKENNFVNTGVSGEIYSINFKDFKVTKLEADLSNSPISSERLQLVIDNKDDRPLDISKASVDYYIDKVVFEDSGKQGYKLLFGNPYAARPSYDIEKYSVYIENEGQDLCSLGGAVIAKEEAKAYKNVDYKPMLNVIIGAVSIGLILLAAWKLAGKKTD